MTDEADPDFLALTIRQRSRIDKAYDRGLPKLPSSSTRKRRKLNTASGSRPKEDDDGGGFMVDDVEGEGGFMEDTNAGEGGFIADEDVGGDEGGFMVDDENETGPAENLKPTKRPSPPISSIRPGRVPLSSIPRLLGLLSLPADEDVMNVFRASAAGWTTDDDDDEAIAGPSRRGGIREKGKSENDQNLFVERKDFRAVCAAIMAGEDDNEEDGKERDDGMDIDQDEIPEGSDSDDEDEDTFELDDEGSELSSLSSDSEYGASRKKTRASEVGGTSASGRTRRSKRDEANNSLSTTPAKTRGKKGPKLNEDQGPKKLIGRQREVARELWDMMKGKNGSEGEKEKSAGRGKKGDANSFILGREEVKKWVREMGEMWTEDEITDMVTLFSTQHEGRGLSFDDFGQIMLRARVV